jgi:hypothetical protein
LRLGSVYHEDGNTNDKEVLQFKEHTFYKYNTDNNEVCILCPNFLYDRPLSEKNDEL